MAHFGSPEVPLVALYVATVLSGSGRTQSLSPCSRSVCQPLIPKIDPKPPVSNAKKFDLSNPVTSAIDNILCKSIGSAMMSFGLVVRKWCDSSVGVEDGLIPVNMAPAPMIPRYNTE